MIDEIMLTLGYQNGFADRGTLQEAYDYLILIADASDNPAAVITAAMVYQNTLIKLICESYDLTPKED